VGRKNILELRCYNWLENGESRSIGRCSKAEGLKALQDEDNIEKARMYYQKAINDYLRIHEIEPKDVDSLLGISTVYFEQKDYVQSKKYVDEALGIDPNNTDARKMSRGLVRLINKQSSPGQ
jgi:tetratricopeptide (TPR) repeat protein